MVIGHALLLLLPNPQVHTHKVASPFFSFFSLSFLIHYAAIFLLLHLINNAPVFLSFFLLNSYTIYNK